MLNRCKNTEDKPSLKIMKTLKLDVRETQHISCNLCALFTRYSYSALIITTYYGISIYKPLEVITLKN